MLGTGHTPADSEREDHLQTGWEEAYTRVVGIPGCTYPPGYRGGIYGVSLLLPREAGRASFASFLLLLGAGRASFASFLPVLRLKRA